MGISQIDFYKFSIVIVLFSIAVQDQSDPLGTPRWAKYSVTEYNFFLLIFHVTKKSPKLSLISPQYFKTAMLLDIIFHSLIETNRPPAPTLHPCL